MNPLLEIKQRLVYSAIAGTQLLTEDFRLKRTMEAISPLAGKNPVFQKIYTGLEQLFTAEESKRNGMLLDLLGLVDAVLYTQGKTQVEGEKIHLETVSGNAEVMQIRYSELAPLVEALTTTGSGRMEVLKDTLKERTELLADYRVLHLLINDLDDAYGEMAALVYRVLENMITQKPMYFIVDMEYDPNNYQFHPYSAYHHRTKAYPLPKVDHQMLLYLLKKDFDDVELVRSKQKLFAKKVQLIQKIAGNKEDAWYLSLLETVEKDVRESAIKALGCDKKNIPLLWDLVKTEKGNCKKSVMCALANCIDADAKPFWEKECKKRIGTVMYLVNNTDDISSDVVAGVLQNTLQDVLDGVESKLSEEDMQTVLRATRGKSSDDMIAVWKWIFANMQELQKKEKKLKSSYTSYQGLCIEIMRTFRKTVLWDRNPKMVAMTREILADTAWAYDLLFHLDLLSEPAKDVYDKWLEKTNLFAPNWFDCIYYQGDAEQNQYVCILDTQQWDEDVYTLTFDRKVIPLAEPLDHRWFTCLKKVHADEILARLLPTDNPDLLQYYGAYFYERALCYESKDYHGYQSMLYLTALQKCQWKKWSGVIAYMCKTYKNLYLSEISQWFESYEKFADDVKAEGKRVMAVYKNQKWLRDGMTTIEDLKKMLIANGWL